MINPVNTFPVSYNTAIPNNVSQMQSQTIQQPPVQNPNMSGLDALAAYNQPTQKMSAPKHIEPALPTVLQPEAIKAIKGERIYTSTGTLDSIVSKGDNTKTVYKMDAAAQNDAIRKIEYYDNSTGKLKFVQENFNLIEQGKMPQIKETSIKEFDQNTGKIKKETIYCNGKLDGVKEFEYSPDGGFEKIYGVYPDGKSDVTEICYKTNSSRLTAFDKKGNVDYVTVKDSNKGTVQSTQYKNGVPVKISQTKNTVIPNSINKNPMTDPELVPTNPINLGYEPKDVQGDKSYYSNGALESITTMTDNGVVMHKFNPDGTLSGIMNQSGKDEKTIIFNRTSEGQKYYSVEEKLDDDVYKTTIFNQDGSKEVCVMDNKNKSEKNAVYSKDGNLEKYFEYSKDDKMMMEFDKQGNVINIYN